nr:MAG TPA: hypothetical protein [Caudoviricetes sp.]
MNSLEFFNVFIHDLDPFSRSPRYRFSESFISNIHWGKLS